MLTGVVILLFLALIVSQPFSVIGVSQVKVGDDGQPYWLIQADGRQIGGDYTFTAVANDLEEYPTSQGNIVPQEDISISIKDIQTECVYIMGDAEDRFTEDIFQLFGSDKYYYAINPNTKTSVFMTFVDDISNKEQTIDALNWIDGNQISFTHNGGEITIEPLGGFSGNYRCPQLSEYAVAIDRDNNNKISFEEYRIGYFGTVSFTDRTSEVTNVLGLDCSVPVVDDEKNAVGQKITCKVQGGDEDKIVTTSNPSVLFTADANYLDFKYMPTTVGEPKIIDIYEPESLNAGEVSSINVKVKNVGDNRGNFKVAIDSPSITTSPSSIGLTLESGEEEEVSFVAIAPSGQTSDFVSSCEVQFCSLGEFANRGVCVTSDACSIDVKEQKVIDIIPKDNTCGNNVCDAGETSATCPTDCGTQLTCDKVGMTKINNKCVCQDGYELKFDKYSNEYCSEIEVENNIVIYGVLALVLVILIVMIIIAKRKK